MNRVYIAGPLFGRTIEEAQADFGRAKIALSLFHLEPVSAIDVPAHAHRGACPPGRQGIQTTDHTDTCFLRADLAALLTCDGIALLPGWNVSWGARLEAQVAMACGLRVFYLQTIGEDKGYDILSADLRKWSGAWA